MRIAINLAIGSEETVADWGPDAVATIQHNVREKFIKSACRFISLCHFIPWDCFESVK